MDTVATGVFWFLAIVGLLAVAISWLTQPKESRNTYHFPAGGTRILGFSAFPLLVLMALHSVVALNVWYLIPFVLLGVALPWLLSGFQLPAFSRGLLLLVLTVLLTPVFQQSGSFSTALAGFAWGIALWKVSSAFEHEPKSAPLAPWEDALPALAWVVGLFWIDLSATAANQVVLQGLLAGSLGLGVLLSLLQRLPFPVKGQAVIQPFLLAAMGGVGFMILSENILLAPAYAGWGWLFGGGILLASLLDAIDTQLHTPSGKDEKTGNGTEPYLFLALAIIGIGTLLASRLFDSFGWVILTVALLSYARYTGTKTFLLGAAGLFWLTRTLLQGFLNEHNLNVTGVNLMHPYVSAAMFGGLMLVLLLPTLLKEAQRKPVAILLFLGAGSLLPMASNYFLHVEASGSLYITILIAALTVSLVGTYCLAIREGFALAGQRQLLWVPAQMIPVAMITHPLLPLGHAASRQEQLAVLAFALIILVIFSVTLYKLWTRGKAVNVS